ncbi:MAG TPA: hypothetical protein VFH13_04130 [Gemmatimonadaceae bacterium]|nr:hypothetical protein [Gemmatimonadaceae bacterium]
MIGCLVRLERDEPHVSRRRVEQERCDDGAFLAGAFPFHLALEQHAGSIESPALQR